jgi:myosin protein heavy chain
MAKSVEVLQANLTMSTKTNEDIVQSYENEITKLREANVEKADEITGLVQVSSANIAKADLMESQLDDLTAKLNEEKLFNAGSSSELGKLAAKLDETEAQLIVLRNESQTLQAQFQELGKQKQTLEQTLADERERSDIVLEEKVTCIAILDQELAERLNELFSLNQTLGSVEHQLEEMTSKYSIEKERANNLEVDIRQLKENATLTADDSVSLVEATNLAELYKEKTNALVQRALLSEQIINNKLSEIANLRNELDEVSLLAKSQPADYAGTDELIAELNSEIAGLKLATRQSQAKANEKLLLQSQTVTDLSEQIKKLEESSSRAVTEAKQAQAETETTIAQLTSSLDNTKKEYDQKISVAEIALKTKEERITQLQNDIDKMIKSQKEESKSSSKTKEESSKAKEKLLLKNQLIKEKEDVISQLNNQLNDLQFEKEHIEQTLQAEIKRNEDFYHSHELQLKEMKEKLKEQHAADVTKMNETVLQHELEIQSLKEKLAESVSLRRQSSAVDKHHAELLIVQELQNSLQQSKKKEVELINRNMMLKNKVEFLEARSKMLTTPLSDEPSKKQESVPAEIGLPSYYKESKRSRIRRVIGSIWGRITRRNKN